VSADDPDRPPKSADVPPAGDATAQGGADGGPQRDEGTPETDDATGSRDQAGSPLKGDHSDRPPQSADVPPAGGATAQGGADGGPQRDEATPETEHAATGDLLDPTGQNMLDSALQNTEGEIVPAFPTFAASGGSELAMGDPGVVHSLHEALGGAGDKGGFGVEVFGGNSWALQALDTPSMELAEKVLFADTQPTGDCRYEIQFPMYRTETSSDVGQFFSPDPPEADFDAYAKRSGLPDVSRTSKPDVVIAHLLTDESGGKHFVTGHTLPQGLTDDAAAGLVVSDAAVTGSPRFNVTDDSFRAPGGGLNIVAEKGWYTVQERVPWDEYVARRDELLGPADATAPPPRPAESLDSGDQDAADCPAAIELPGSHPGVVTPGESPTRDESTRDESQASRSRRGWLPFVAAVALNVVGSVPPESTVSTQPPSPTVEAARHDALPSDVNVVPLLDPVDQNAQPPPVKEPQTPEQHHGPEGTDPEAKPTKPKWGEPPKGPKPPAPPTPTIHAHSRGRLGRR
jgi:hypothetical protein